ncbi:sensor histidine kinase [Rhodobacteraceae bacterium nBUS_24]
MKVLSTSLRTRLLILILLPLLIVAFSATFWRYMEARKTAENIFDRQLIMLCLAVSRDVAYSGGDSLSVTTQNLFEQAAGGAIYYHVYGPDGSFVTGYSSPPVRDAAESLEHNIPFQFNARHLGRNVRAVSLAEPVIIGGISGVSVVTVWQELEPRQKFARNLALQAAFITALLVLTAASVVIFGVRLGLRPLGRLEAAIKTRSPSDIRPIERPVPIEARGIVSRLNILFQQLTEAQEARDRLISNAAHQLRNPVAAIHSMAQATLAAKSLSSSKERAMELVAETRRTVRLTNQMLSLERLRGVKHSLHLGDVNIAVKELTLRLAPKVLDRDVEFTVHVNKQALNAKFDPMLLNEAITNLVENALQHGGALLSEIIVSVTGSDGFVVIHVENDGDKIKQNEIEVCFDRFSQIGEHAGSGLGLAIVHEIAKIHKGEIRVATEPRMRFALSIPY